MAQAMCFSCEMVFPSEAVFLEHKAGGHMLVGKPLRTPTPRRITLDQAKKLEEPTPNLPPGIPPEALPTPEFLETVARIEGDETVIDKEAIEAHKKEMEAELKNAPVPEPEKPKVAKPIELRYFYVGECPDCFSQVTTLEVDLDKQHFCIAYCSKENKQLLSRPEKKL